MSDEVLVSRDGAITTLTLNRPERLNAWTRTMETQLFDALDAADDDPSVRVIVLTGSGRGFCPGMDADSLARAAKEGASAPDPRPMTHGLSIRKPLLAAINGACAGIGLVQALVCDLRFAAAGAKLATSFTRRGLHAEFSTSWLLPRLVGYGNAMDLLLSGRTVLAEEALALGLVNRVVEPDALLDATYAYARDLVESCSPVAMAAVKGQVAADWTRSQPESFAAADAIGNEKGRGVDFAEGIRSFVERRPPRFRGLPPRERRPSPLTDRTYDS